VISALLVAVARRVVRHAHDPAAACACCGRLPDPRREVVEVSKNEARSWLADIASGLLDLPEYYFDALTARDLDSLEACVQVARNLRRAEWEEIALIGPRDAQAWVRKAPTRDATHGFPGDIALRCSMCAVDWPPTPPYAVCPLCAEPTSIGSGLAPLSVVEALRLIDERTGS